MAKHKYYMVPDSQINRILASAQVHQELTRSLAAELQLYRRKYGPLTTQRGYIEVEVP